MNRIFPAQDFHASVVKFLEEQLEVNDGKSMMETKRLQNAPRRSERMMAVFDAMEALAERFVEGAPAQRFRDKKALLECKYCPTGFQNVTNMYSKIHEIEALDMKIVKLNEVDDNRQESL